MKRKYHNHDVIGSQLHNFGFVCDERCGANLPLEQLLQQQSQGLPSASDLQSLEDMLSGQGFETNLQRHDARRAKDPVIPNEQNV